MSFSRRVLENITKPYDSYSRIRRHYGFSGCALFVGLMIGALLNLSGVPITLSDTLISLQQHFGLTIFVVVNVAVIAYVFIVGSTVMPYLKKNRFNGAVTNEIIWFMRFQAICDFQRGYGSMTFIFAPLLLALIVMFNLINGLLILSAKAILFFMDLFGKKVKDMPCKSGEVDILSIAKRG